MFQNTKLRFNFLSIFIISILFSFIFYGSVHAKEFSNYSYKQVYNALPKKYQSNTYIYDQNGDGYIRFANDDNGKSYVMSVKKSSDNNNYIYCIDYAKRITMNTSYKSNNKIFNNELRTRIGIALEYGTSSWNKKADEDYTTGNSIVDYYMTQIVIHSLIYHFGDDKSDYGLDHNELSYYDNTATLKKKTKALYNLCSKATIQFENGELQHTQFSFSSDDTNLYLRDNIVSTNTVNCNIAEDNAIVTGFSTKLNAGDIKTATINAKDKSYHSSFDVSIPIKDLDKIEPGNYNISVTENVSFAPYITTFWSCNDKGIGSDNQEVAELTMDSKEVKDTVNFQLLIGAISLKKMDSISGAVIPDAQFEVQQYNDTTKEYESYKDLIFDSKTQLYVSGNLYTKATNSKAMYKVIEKKAGANYTNNWPGQAFHLSPDTYEFLFNVENQPILGSLHIKKTGDNPEFNNNTLEYINSPLRNVVFELYAANDILIKNNTIFKANQKIMELVTDDNGEAHADELPIGDYYIKEKETTDYHIIDPESHSFSITQDNNRKYTNYMIDLKNNRKNCSIELFKYTLNQSGDSDVKKPLKQAVFGLYAAEDIMDTNGNIIIEKDSLLSSNITNEQGTILFENLLYADYYLKELEAPEGYIINETIIPISKNDFIHTESNNYICTKECMDQQKLFQVKITKTGETFNKTQTLETANGIFTQYQSQPATLSKVTFSLYRKEDNQLISELETNDNGIAVFENLVAGEYYIKETAAPQQYIIDSTPIDIKINNADYDPMVQQQLKSGTIIEINDSKTGVSLQPIIDKNISNQLYTTHIKIKKVGESQVIQKNKLAYENIPLKNVVFGLYQDFDYKLSSKVVITKNTCVGYLTTNNEGIATLDVKVPSGKYYLKELKTNKNYVLDKDTYPIDIQAKDNTDVIIDLSTEHVFENKLSKSSVEIYKTDSDTKKPIKNVEFTLYNDKNEVIGIYKTNRKGKLLVSDLPYGKYYFIETKCRNGYYSTNNKFRFTLDNDKTITLNITNQPILKLGFSEPYKIILSILLVLFVSILWIINTRGKNCDSEE